MPYSASEQRYDSMVYNRCGRSGIKLPAISLGLWHNFGGVDVFETGREMVLRAFDLGITHFDLANNYGPPPGSAEETSCHDPEATTQPAPLIGETRGLRIGYYTNQRTFPASNGVQLTSP